MSGSCALPLKFRAVTMLNNLGPIEHVLQILKHYRPIYLINHYNTIRKHGEIFLVTQIYSQIVPIQISLNIFIVINVLNKCRHNC